MIFLYGALAKAFGKSIAGNVSSVQELMRCAEANVPGFTKKFKKDGLYLIRRGKNFRSAKQVDAQEVEMRFGDTDWHIVPMPTGHSGVARLVAGAVLMIVGAIIVVAYGWTGAGGAGAALIKLGAVVAFSGLAAIMAPTAKLGGSSERPGEEPSFLFDGPTNRATAGGASTLIYGDKVYVGSNVISGGLTIGNIT